MLIVNKKSFASGMLLMVSFIALFIVIIMPIFPNIDGGKTTGLDYADNMFNSLSKGSSDFFDTVEVKVNEIKNVEIEYTAPITPLKGITFTKDQLMETMAVVLDKAGATVVVDMHEISVKGNLGDILTAIVAVSKDLYNNDASAVSVKYDGLDPFLVASSLWHFLKPSIKELQIQGHIQEAKAVDVVMRRALETGYNFYGVKATKVSEEFILMTSVLVFYVIYTMWYGFAIFNIFDGIGLTMSKSKVKEEH